MQRFKIKIMYDGSQYAGWQIQPEDVTIQGVIEKVLARFNEGNAVPVTGSGRTDSGVHAFGQIAHFDLSTRLDTCELQKALNATLPDDIKILEMDAVGARFHARYSAIKRHYNYQIYTGKNLLMRNQAWMLDEIDLNKLNEVAEMVLGDHDFTSFAKKNPDIDHYNCTIYHSAWKESNGLVTYSIIGNRFLHHMVRYLTGTMVAIAQGRFEIGEFQKLLNKPTEMVSIFKAPAQGLILKEVIYE